MNHKADRDQAIAIMVNKRAAPRIRGKRPAKAVLYQPWPMLLRRNPPDLLDSEAVLLWRRVSAKLKPLLQVAGKRPAYAFSDERITGLNFNTRRELRTFLDACGATHVTGYDSSNLPLLAIQDFLRG